MFGQLNTIALIMHLHWGEQKMETATSCTKYSQVAGLVHMLGEDCTMVSCHNDIFNYSCQDTTIINGYMYTCKMVISSACMEESAAAMTVFNLYCSHN